VFVFGCSISDELIVRRCRSEIVSAAVVSCFVRLFKDRYRFALYPE